jgi:hypothetical protein
MSGDPRQQVIDFYVGKGLPEFAARGIARRWNVESGIKPDAYNPAGGGMGAYGGAQWRGPRLKALLERPDAHTLQGQLEHSWEELQGPEKKTLDALKKAKTEQQAYETWTSLYERPGPRQEYAAGGIGGGGAPLSMLLSGLSGASGLPLPQTPIDQPFSPRLGGALSAAPEAPPQPAVAAPPAQTALAPHPLHLRGMPAPPVPNLRAAFRRALDAILKA